MNADDPFDELASSVSDGETIDWEQAESTAASSERGARVRGLRELALIADFSRALQREESLIDPAAPTTVPTPQAESRWGPFTLLEPIGAGSNGEVWRAWDASLLREVAVKFLQDRAGVEAERGAALLDEARAVARVRHASVVDVYGIGEYDGRLGMWMEFLRGPTLGAEIERRGGLPWVEVAGLGAALAAALEALDLAGLVHRDVKPSNIVLESDGRVVLTDFGLGSRLTFLPDSSSRRASGTPLFMAPSLLDGGAPTPRTDLYALGVTLRWALTGHPPFQAHTMEELREQVRRGSSLALANECASAPAPLVAAIERAMGGAPYRAAALRADLQSILDDARAATTPAPTPGSASGSPRPSVAVLPFLDRGRDQGDEHFSDGLADEILNVLAKIQGLHVAARTSSFSFKGKHEDLETVGRKLHVAAVLEGSVRRSGDRVRIAVRLIEVARGEPLWSESYDRALDDLFAVQDDIAQRVVEALRATLMSPAAGADDVRAEVVAATRGRGRDPEAHRLFLLARSFIFRCTPEDLKQGVERLEQAVARDATHAIAWAELGNLYATLGDLGIMDQAEGYRRGRAGILRALDVEPDLPEGHARLARLQAADREWRKAEASFRRALEGNPGSATVLHGAAILAQGLGRSDEAIELNRRAIEVDPLSSASRNNLGAVYYEAGRLAEAEKAFREALEIAPQRYGTRSFLAQVLARRGRREEALAEALEEPEEVYRLLAQVVIHHRFGAAAECTAAIQAMLDKFQDAYPVQIAEAFGERGDLEHAFEWLERALKAGDPGLMHIKPSPHFRALRADPRWPVFMARMGLAD